MKIYTYPETTFELCFFDLSGRLDSIQQYRSENEAQDALKMFDEPGSADLYSRIELTRTVWHKNAQQDIISVLCI